MEFIIEAVLNRFYSKLITLRIGDMNGHFTHGNRVIILVFNVKEILVHSISFQTKSPMYTLILELKRFSKLKQIARSGPMKSIHISEE